MAKIKLYKDYLEEKEKKEEVKEAAASIGADPEKVVIKKEAAIVGILKQIGKGILMIIKILFWLAIAALSSIGATVLANEPLRELFFSMFK